SSAATSMDGRAGSKPHSPGKVKIERRLISGYRPFRSLFALAVTEASQYDGRNGARFGRARRKSERGAAEDAAPSSQTSAGGRRKRTRHNGIGRRPPALP